jgi:hypothetical protein
VPVAPPRSTAPANGIQTGPSAPIAPANPNPIGPGNATTPATPPQPGNPNPMPPGPNYNNPNYNSGSNAGTNGMTSPGQ